MIILFSQLTAAIKKHKTKLESALSLLRLVTYLLLQDAYYATCSLASPVAKLSLGSTPIWILGLVYNLSTNFFKVA